MAMSVPLWNGLVAMTTGESRDASFRSELNRFISVALRSPSLGFELWQSQFVSFQAQDWEFARRRFAAWRATDIAPPGALGRPGAFLIPLGSSHSSIK